MATKPNDDSSLSHTRWNCKYYNFYVIYLNDKRMSYGFS